MRKLLHIDIETSELLLNVILSEAKYLVLQSFETLRSAQGDRIQSFSEVSYFIRYHIVLKVHSLNQNTVITIIRSKSYYREPLRLEYKTCWSESQKSPSSYLGDHDTFFTPTGSDEHVYGTFKTGIKRLDNLLLKLYIMVV
jgi:hypothetical protein